jgi:hypothetical protein
MELRQTYSLSATAATVATAAAAATPTVVVAAMVAEDATMAAGVTGVMAATVAAASTSGGAAAVAAVVVEAIGAGAQAAWSGAGEIIAKQLGLESGVSCVAALLVLKRARRAGETA